MVTVEQAAIELISGPALKITAGEANIHQFELRWKVTDDAVLPPLVVNNANDCYKHDKRNDQYIAINDQLLHNVPR